LGPSGDSAYRGGSTFWKFETFSPSGRPIASRELFPIPGNQANKRATRTDGHDGAVQNDRFSPVNVGPGRPWLYSTWQVKKFGSVVHTYKDDPWWVWNSLIARDPKKIRVRVTQEGWMLETCITEREREYNRARSAGRKQAARGALRSLLRKARRTRNSETTPREESKATSQTGPEKLRGASEARLSQSLSMTSVSATDLARGRLY